MIYLLKFVFIFLLFVSYKNFRKTGMFMLSLVIKLYCVISIKYLELIVMNIFNLNTIKAKQIY